MKWPWLRTLVGIMIGANSVWDRWELQLLFFCITFCLDLRLLLHQIDEMEKHTSEPIAAFFSSIAEQFEAIGQLFFSITAPHCDGQFSRCFIDVHWHISRFKCLLESAEIRLESIAFQSQRSLLNRSRIWDDPFEGNFWIHALWCLRTPSRAPKKNSPRLCSSISKYPGQFSLIYTEISCLDGL